jgi:hypothetical protein
MLGNSVAVTSTFIECRSTPPNSTPSGRAKRGARSAGQLGSKSLSGTAIPLLKSLSLFYDSNIKKATSFFINCQRETRT